MKRITIFIILLIAVLSFSSSSFTQLNVERPAGVVAQPYFVRGALFPAADGAYSIGLEGHIDLLGINASIGMYTSYPAFSFDSEVYIGLGINLGGLFASLNATTTSFETISDLSTYGQPKVAFGIASYKRTYILSSSWSRLELSYEPNEILKLNAGTFEIAENPDFLDASINFSIESYDVGYFTFKFGLGNLKELVEGSFNYYFDMAIPLGDVPYIYFGQSYSGSWKIGGGLSASWLNVFGVYEFESGTFSWGINGQI
ncbi:MAG TPA: hypothetical protein PKI14_10375 [Fervidobacterium sp.]|nr:hypothetical protein [Fervidobacterium sp.]HPZ18249.1 hypothetical protein [Fervidobacterium sp.]HQE49496.1 hypothetical protein [Fervidobacterium sp.]HUM43341.1 hypothetical protein [Fervidobacterium sp.]